MTPRSSHPAPEATAPVEAVDPLAPEVDNEGVAWVWVRNPNDQDAPPARVRADAFDAMSLKGWEQVESPATTAAAAAADVNVPEDKIETDSDGTQWVWMVDDAQGTAPARSRVEAFRETWASRGFRVTDNPAHAPVPAPDPGTSDQGITQVHDQISEASSGGSSDEGGDPAPNP